MLSHVASRPHAGEPLDPALPELPSLLDLEIMSPILQRSLRERTELEDLRIHRIRYNPLKRVMVHYRATAGGRLCDGVATVIAGQDLAQKVGKPRFVEMASVVDGRSPARSPVLYEPAVNAILTWLPFDIKLPAVAQPAGDLVERLQAAGVRIEDSETQVAMLRYKPGQRAVMRVEDHVLKAYGETKRFTAARDSLRAVTDEHSIPTAPFEASLDDLNLTVQGAVEGPKPTAAEVAEDAGAFLRHLQGLDFDRLVPASPEWQLGEAHRHAGVAAMVVPSLAPRLQALMARLEDALPAGEPLVASHGDFNINQLKIAGGMLYILDFDDMCSAPAAHDLGEYAAWVADPHGDLSPIYTVLDSLIEGYGSRPRGLDWYATTSLLCRVTHPFRRLAPDWHERIETLVGVAEAVLEP